MSFTLLKWKIRLVVTTNFCWTLLANETKNERPATNEWICRNSSHIEYEIVEISIGVHLYQAKRYTHAHKHHMYIVVAKIIQKKTTKTYKFFLGIASKSFYLFYFVVNSKRGDTWVNQSKLSKSILSKIEPFARVLFCEFFFFFLSQFGFAC